MPSTTVLSIYNNTLTLLGARPLVTATDSVESRRVMDAIYPDVKQYCLEQAVWNFSMRVASVSSTAGGVAGFSIAFPKPTDLIHLFTVSLSSTYEPPLNSDQFLDHGGFLYAATSPIYVRYSSSDATSYGGVLTNWPSTFAAYVSAALASWACVRITGSSNYLPVLARREEALLQRSMDIDAISYLPGKLPFNQDARNMMATQAAKPDQMPFVQHAPAAREER